MFRKLALFSTIVLLLITACGGAAPTAPAAGNKLKVVATFSILGNLVQNVGGDKIELRVLVGPDADTHTFEPSPADGAALTDASVVFEDGLGFESWLSDLYSASGSKAKRVVVTKGVTPGVIAIGDEVGKTDPHAWQDVAYVINMVTIIRDTLASEDPANAEAYKNSADPYLKQLSDLDQYIKDQVATLPLERRKLVTNHDALGYFAKRYGFEIIGNAISSVSTEAGDPSAEQIARLVDEVKSANVPAIFTENIENSKIIEQVARESGVVIGQPLYTDALGQPGSEGDTYLKMMRHNIDAIVSGLK